MIPLPSFFSASIISAQIFMKQSLARPTRRTLFSTTGNNMKNSNLTFTVHVPISGRLKTIGCIIAQCHSGCSQGPKSFHGCLSIWERFRKLLISQLQHLGGSSNTDLIFAVQSDGNYQTTPHSTQQSNLSLTLLINGERPRMRALRRSFETLRISLKSWSSIILAGSNP